MAELTAVPGDMADVVLVRHGRTVWNLTGRFQGQSDIPLDDVGQAQAAAAAPLVTASFPNAELVSSDLIRAQQTAAAIAELLGVGIAIDERLREQAFGAWEGLTRDEIEAGWPDGLRAWRSGADLGDEVGAESRQALQDRMVAAIEERAALVGPQSTVIVVSHGAAITAAIAGLLGHPATWRGVVGLDNCHWTHLIRSPKGTNPKWRVVAHNLGVPPALDLVTGTPGV